MSSLTERATEAAVLVSGLDTVVSTPLFDADGYTFSTSPFGLPGPDSSGFDVAGRIAADLKITLHEDVRRRVCYILYDAVNADYNGELYKLNVGAGEVSSDDTTIFDSFADWLDDFAQRITDDAGSAALVEVSPVRYKAPAEGDTGPDALRIAAVLSLGTESLQVPDGATYTSFDLLAVTGPASADITVLREVEAVDAQLYARSSGRALAAVAGLDTAGVELARSAWHYVQGGQLSVDNRNLDLRIDVAGRSEVHLLVTTATPPAGDTIAVSVGAADIRRIVPLVRPLVAGVEL